MAERQIGQGKQAVLQNIAALIDFLQRFEPFKEMAPRELEHLVRHSRLAFYAEGDEILAPADGTVRELSIIKQGRVRGERPATPETPSQPTLELHEGEVFPIGAILGERPTRTVYRAATDVFCLELDGKAFADLFTDSEPFRDFCLRGVSSLLERVRQRDKRRAVERIGSEHPLDAQLAELVRRKPVTCPPDTSIRVAISLMHEHKVGSMVITDAGYHPLGIFTLHDLRRLVAQGMTDFEQPISNVMTTNPMSLPPADFAFDAAVTMANHQFRHILITDQGKLLGIVSERDLFALQRVNLVHLSRTIAQADSIDALTRIGPEIRRLIDTMLAHGAAVAQINRIITTLNDHTVTRCIELSLAESGDPGIVFTWLTFGSEGRREQTLWTDQDNGILFQPPPGMSPQEARSRLVPLARRINENLALAGFPLCRGNIMASNPELCLSAPEWRDRFRRMIAQATPENLLRSAIYFDLRPVWGPLEPAQELFGAVVAEAAANQLLQHMMAANALRNPPPLGLLRDFVTHEDRLDLKIQGLTPFVDSARVLALSRGLTATNTLERLEALAELGVIPAKKARAWSGSYSFVQTLRMRLHQEQAQEGVQLSNKLDPDTLNPLDRRILKEAFRQARDLHRRLQSEFQT